MNLQKNNTPRKAALYFRNAKPFKCGFAETGLTEVTVGDGMVTLWYAGKRIAYRPIPLERKEGMTSVVVTMAGNPGPGTTTRINRLLSMLGADTYMQSRSRFYYLHIGNPLRPGSGQYSIPITTNDHYEVHCAH